MSSTQHTNPTNKVLSVPSPHCPRVTENCNFEILLKLQFFSVSSPKYPLCNPESPLALVIRTSFSQININAK